MVVKLDEKESAFFEYRVSQSGSTISLRSRVKINRTVFGNDEYENLREFFNMIVNKQIEQIVFKIINLKEAVYHRKVVYTILNESGERYAAMVVGYDKLRKISSLDGTLYDAKGNVLRKAKNKDIQDYSAVQDISLFDDNRVKVLDFTNQFYPYTVEFETEVRYNNTYMQ